MEYPKVVISDLHGQVQKLIAVLMHYGNDYQYIFNGDVIDRGPDSKGTLEVIRSMGDAAILLTGNHEWTLRAALTDADSLRREMWRDEVWLNPSLKRRLESRFLESYGIVTDKINEDITREIRYRMWQLGHLALLEEAQMYYEDDEIVVVHAGLDGDQTWVSQRRQLDTYESLANSHIFTDEPPQLFDFRLCDSFRLPRDFGARTLITGHTHLRLGADDRITSRKHTTTPLRVRLASHLQAGDPLYIYETDSQEVREF